MMFSYNLIRSNRKTIQIQILPDKTIEVRAPKYVSDKRIRSFMSLHEQIELFLSHNHLHKIGFNASGIGDEIDVLPLGRGISHEAHIKLTHSGIIVVELGNDDLVDVLKIHAAGQALLCAKQNTVSAFLEGFP